jgi:hypothetical protein
VRVLRRQAIRFGAALAGIAAGVVISDLVLSRFSISAVGVLEVTLLFWIVHVLVSLFALRVLVRQPSVALAGLLALGSTVVALIIVNLIVSGLSIHGASTYVAATIIIWATTAVGDTAGRRLIRADRQAARDSR